MADSILKTEAYVCPNKGEPFELKTVELPPLQDNEVEVHMTHSGLCHTDLHMQNNDWGISNFPCVCGHEGIGIVKAIGSRVVGFENGQRVGIGWLRDSCGLCRNCLAGRDNICEKGYQGTFLNSNAGVWGKKACSMYGCFSKVMRINAKFAFKIPDPLPSDKAAPLLCAGITVWEPIRDYVQPGTRVGVRSLGGLGHMAVRLAKACGGVVTVLSTSASKEQRARALGASHFVVTSNAEQMAAAGASLDLIIDTCPQLEKGEDVATWMNLLAFGGTYCRVGIPNASFKYDYIPLVFTQKKIVGSIVSGSMRTNEMLEVAANHNIVCEVEVVPFAQLNSVLRLLAEQKNNEFRYVLKW